MAEPLILDAVRWFLALFFPGVALFYILRLTKRRSALGHSAVSHGAVGSQAWWLAKTFVVFRTAITVAMLARAFWPSLDSSLLACPWLMTSAVVVTGVAVMVGAFTVVVVLNLTMGDVWRSGLATAGGPPPLITTGAFAWTRNPMFLAVQVAQFGFFLAFPSGFTLLCLLAGVVVLHLQVRLEEAHLLRVHGEAYRDYAARTPRWFTLRHLLVRTKILPASA
ncbi:MAG TPA: isoprenylcysteine carboxylmethyltransferase family protein [Kiloniellaceae bacterium]|nr:isoprenylcysteine carboxylmethyltransferase family protein [Kiloniellaceae bacterium]